MTSDLDNAVTSPIIGHPSAGEPCWAALPVSLFTEILRQLIKAEEAYASRGLDNLVNISSGWLSSTPYMVGSGDIFASEAQCNGTVLSNMAQVSLVCRDWWRLCHEGMATLRPAALPVLSSGALAHAHSQLQLQQLLYPCVKTEASELPAHAFAHAHAYPHQQQGVQRCCDHHQHYQHCLQREELRGCQHMNQERLEYKYKEQPHKEHRQEWQQQQQQQQQHVKRSQKQGQQLKLVPEPQLNAWLAFPYLTELDLSAVQVAVHDIVQLRHQQEALEGLGQLYQLRSLRLPLALLAVTAAPSMNAAIAAGASNLRTALAAGHETPSYHRGPQLLWPLWLPRLPYLAELAVFTHCRTALYGTGNSHHHYHHHQHYCCGPLDSIVSRFDGIRVLDLPPLPALASLELQLPGGAVSGGGLLRNLPSLTSLRLHSADSRPLVGLQLAAVLSEGQGAGQLTRLHLPCLSASPSQPPALLQVAAGPASDGPSLEGLRALAAAAGFPLATESAYHPPPPPPHEGHLYTPMTAVPPAAALRTSLQSLSLSGRCFLTDLLAAAAHLSAVKSLCLAGCDVRPRGLAEGLLTRHNADGGGSGVWEQLYGAAAAVPPPAWQLRRLNLAGCHWLSSVPLFAANISKLLVALCPPGDLQVLNLSTVGISRLPEVLLLPPLPPLPPPLMPTSISKGYPGPNTDVQWPANTANTAASESNAMGSLGAFLRELDLSRNFLQAIPEALTAACPRLRTLRVDGNAALPVRVAGGAALVAYRPYVPFPANHRPPGLAAVAAAVAAAAAGSPGGGAAAGRGPRVTALPPELEDLSLLSNSSVTPLCTSAAVLSVQPATRLRRLRVSHSSLPALVAMLPYMPVLSELIAVEVPANVRGAVGLSAVGSGSGIPRGNASGRQLQLLTSPCSTTVSLVTATTTAAAGGLASATVAVSTSLSYVTIRGDVTEDFLVRRRDDGGGGGGGSSDSDCIGADIASVGGSGSNGGSAAQWWLERLCACAPEMRALSYTRMGLTAVPDGIAAAFKLVSLDLSRNLVFKVSDAVGNLSRLENLDLSCNRLANLPHKPLARLTRLASLHVYGNPALPTAAVATLERSLPGLVQLRSDSYLSVSGGRSGRRGEGGSRNDGGNDDVEVSSEEKSNGRRADEVWRGVGCIGKDTGTGTTAGGGGGGDGGSDVGMSTDGSGPLYGHHRPAHSGGTHKVKAGRRRRRSDGASLMAVAAKEPPGESL